MSLLLELAVAIFVIWLIYKWFETYQINKKLNWLKEVPGWPIVGNSLEFGDNSETLSDFQRLINKYGKLIKMNFASQTYIVATDYDFIEFLSSSTTILNKEADYKLLRKWLGRGLLTSDGPKWKRSRRIITPAFHFSILEKFVENFELNGKILVECLEKEVGKDSFDIYPYITLHTLDIICETAMGKQVNAQKNKDSKYVQNVKEVLRLITERAFSIFKSNDITYLLTKDYYTERQAIKELHEVTYSVIDSRREELIKNLNKEPKKDKPDEFGRKKRMAFLDILLQSNIDGQPLTREEIREEVDTFMFEGHDTTASAISFAIYLLANHQEVQNRAVEEQKALFGDDIDREASYADLQDMKYLELVIKESLRIYPSVPMYNRTTTEDVEYKGQTIPAGVNLLVFVFGVLRDPDNYPDPEKFDPDRFENFDGKRPYAYIPFSAGSRNCIGQKFAILELKSTLSKILRQFELLPATPEHKIKIVNDGVIKSGNGINIKISKRKW